MTLGTEVFDALWFLEGRQQVTNVRMFNEGIEEKSENPQVFYLSFEVRFSFAIYIFVLLTLTMQLQNPLKH